MTDINAIVAHYITMRDHRAKLDAEHKARVGEIDAQMKNAEIFLLDHMNSTNQRNAGFTNGTVIISDKVLPSFEDKNTTMQFIKETDNMGLLSVRLSSTAVKEFMENNNGQLPPGVKVITERSVSIRRK